MLLAAMDIRLLTAAMEVGLLTAAMDVRLLAYLRAQWRVQTDEVTRGGSAFCIAAGV